MTRPLRVGVQLSPGGTPDYSTWRQAVLDAEAVGADAIFGPDHFHHPAVHPNPKLPEAPLPELMPQQPDVNNFEAWTALASWAEATDRAEIGALVSGVGYRNPDLLADMARTVDHISGGRVILGVGAGWYQKDYVVYGYDYGTLDDRMMIFARSLARIEHRLRNLFPPPTRDIPILIGGSGERRTLPLVGRYAHIWHNSLNLEEFRRKSALVARYAAEAGRVDTDIERSATWVDADNAGALLDEGVTLFIVGIAPKLGVYDLKPLLDMIAWRDAHR